VKPRSWKCALSLSAGPPAGADEALDTLTAEIVGQARHQAGRFLFTHADRHPNQELTISCVGLASPEREKKWTAFQVDPDWIAGRAKTEEDGQIVDNIVSQLLVPTAFRR